MRCLVVYTHPVESSYCAALRECAVATLRAGGHEVRVIDLYGERFDPVLSRQERIDYHTPGVNERAVGPHIEAIRWAEALIFVFPTWWYGLPAILKGWLERVWVPHVAFTMTQNHAPIRGLMHNIQRLGVITTSGAPRWWLIVVGNPGRRTILRGVRALCHPRCRTIWLAHYAIDDSTDRSRAAFLARIERKLGKI